MTQPGEKLVNIWNILCLDENLSRLLFKIKMTSDMRILQAYRDEFKEELKIFQLQVDILKQKRALSYMKEVNEEDPIPISKYATIKELTVLSKNLAEIYEEM